VNFLTPEASYALTLVLPAPPPLPLAEVLFRDSRTSTPLHRQHIHLSLLQNADHQLNGKTLPHGKSPFIGARFRRRLTLNMHQKMWSQSLLNVTELFTKESMGGYRKSPRESFGSCKLGTSTEGVVGFPGQGSSNTLILLRLGN